jgi:hypothetical protein
VVDEEAQLTLVQRPKMLGRLLECGEAETQDSRLECRHSAAGDFDD